jgi:hypothetical protein
MVVSHKDGNSLFLLTEECELNEQLCDFQLTFIKCCWGENEAACVVCMYSN